MEEVNGKPDIKSIARIMFGTGVINLTFIFLTITIALTGFIFKVPITPYHFILAFALTVIGIFISLHFSGQNNSAGRIMAVAGLIFFIVILISCWAVADHFYDTSYDGQWYHQGAIHLLMNGFNPLYQQVSENDPGGLFIGHYPNAFEVSSAVINAFTHHIESGKLLNFLLMITVFLIVFPVIMYSFPGINWVYALAVALLTALNPISIYQSLSYYVDGASVSLLSILVFLLILSYKKIDRLLLLVITFVIVLVVNIKFFNIVYAGVLVAGFITICLINQKSSGLYYLFVLSLLIGVLFGAHPYITNLIDHGTPFYPVNGISADMIAGDVPPNLAGKNSMEQLAISIFSQSDFRKSDAILKIPFTVSSKEIESFYMADSRAGGFGPLFSGAVMLTALLAIILLVVRTGDKSHLNNVILPMCLLLFITVVINPAGWWARYVPQLWLIPLLLLLSAQQMFTNKLKILNYALILVLVLNVCMVALSYYSYQMDITHKINQQISDIRSLTQNKPAQLYCGTFIAAQDRYKEHGINFVLTSTPPDRQWSTLAEVEASYGQVTFY